MLVLSNYIRNIPDFPKKGILFRDITPLLAAPAAFKQAIDQMQVFFAHTKVDVVVGIESRGFIFAPSLALALNAGFVLARKPRRLPYDTIHASYTLEYGTNQLEMNADAIRKGQRVVIVDDLIATGGTMAATLALVTQLEGEVVGCAALIELQKLHGIEKLGGSPFHAVIQYP